MKPSQVIIVTLAVIMVNLSYSQNNTGKNFLGKLYFKAGIEFANYSNSTIFALSSAFQRGGVEMITASAAYEFKRILLFELKYKYLDDFSYNAEESQYPFYQNGEQFYYSAGGSLSSHYIDLRANYFVNTNRRENPVYFIGALSFGYQNVQNSDFYDYTYYTKTVTRKFNRFVIGPEAGFGIFFDLGIFNFQTEFTFCSRISPLSNDRKYTENSVNLNVSPVINFK